MKSKVTLFLLFLLISMNVFATDKNWYVGVSLDCGANLEVSTNQMKFYDCDYYSSNDKNVDTHFLIGLSVDGGYYVGGCVGVGGCLSVSLYTCDYVDGGGYGLYDYTQSCFVYFGPEVSFDYGRLIEKRNGKRKFSIIPVIGCGMLYNEYGTRFSAKGVNASVSYGDEENCFSFCGKFSLKFNIPVGKNSDFYLAPTLIMPFKQNGDKNYGQYAWWRYSKYNMQLFCSVGFSF